MLSTLLYEGYALYPYTPGAIKNATPTPFGIVYPPVYAAGGPHTFDRARMQLVRSHSCARSRFTKTTKPCLSTPAFLLRAWFGGAPKSAPGKKPCGALPAP